MAIKRSRERLCVAYKICDFFTKSTLFWALEKCSEKKERFCEKMALNGNLVLLQYLHDKGCPLDKVTCSAAAVSGGHLECLKYLHEIGCPWDEWTCTEAARGGHLECLKYLHEEGCPWDEWTCTEAAGGGHLECLKYLHDEGCPWDKTVSELSLIHI